MQLPLTRTLDTGEEITPAEHFKSTTQQDFGRKFNADPLKQDPIFNKAPRCTKVNYLKGFHEILNKRISKRSLSPKNQKSETHEEFSAPPPLSQPKDLIGMKNFLLHEYDVHEFNEVDHFSVNTSYRRVYLTKLRTNGRGETALSLIKKCYEILTLISQRIKKCTVHGRLKN